MVIGNMANYSAEALNHVLSEILDEVASEKNVLSNKRSVYWWTPNIKKS